MSKRQSRTTLNYSQKSYSSPVKGVKSPFKRLLKINRTDSVKNLMFKFRHGSKRNQVFMEIWDAVELDQERSKGYFFGAFKLYSDNYKYLNDTFKDSLKKYKIESFTTSIFDYLENYLKLKNGKK